MARTRSVEIQESLHELDQLRQYYRNTPQAQRLLFLYFLKEDPKRTIIEAAEKAEISVRRGERLWECYRRGGLGGVLNRRLFVKQAVGIESQDSKVSTLNAIGCPNSGELMAIVNAVSLAFCADSMDGFICFFKKSLTSLVPDLRHVVVNLRTQQKSPSASDCTDKAMILKGDKRPDGSSEYYVLRTNNEGPVYPRIIQDGKRLKFPFVDYSEPLGFDFYFGNVEEVRHVGEYDPPENYVASIVMFFDKSHTVEFELIRSIIERLRPFLSCVMHFALIKYSSNDSRIPIVKVVEYEGYDPPLTTREKQVLSLRLLGKSVTLIAESLSISNSTVQSHIRSIYKKARVSSHRELVSHHIFAR